MADGPSSALLLFYSAECGLKSAILDQRKWRSTAQLPEHLRNHDLRCLAKELRLPQRISTRMQSCASQAQPSEHVSFSDLHQAWRYGHTLRKDHEAEALAVLHELLNWCQRELRA